MARLVSGDAPGAVYDSRMTEHIGGETEVEAEMPTTTGGVSLLDQLHATRDASAEATTKDYAVPNNGGVLWVTMKLLPMERLQQIGQELADADTFPEQLRIAASGISAASQGLFLRSRDGRTQPWPSGQEKMAFGPQLWEYIRGENAPLPDAAKLSDYVRITLAPPSKGGEAREAAIITFWNMVVVWMNDAGEGVNRDFAEG